METRKTNKWYREMLCKDINSAYSVIADVLNKYGKDKYRTYIPAKSNNEFWNCRIEGIGLTDSGKVYLRIYWQGDSTDGSDSIYLSELMNSRECTISADYSDGYERHSKLRIEREWLPSVFKEVAEYIEPKRVKARKEYEEKCNVCNVLRNELGSYFRDNYCGYGRNERYYNGWEAVRNYISENWKELQNKEHNERLAIVKPIFSANYR